MNQSLNTYLPEFQQSLKIYVFILKDTEDFSVEHEWKKSMVVAISSSWVEPITECPEKHYTFEQKINHEVEWIKECLIDDGYTNFVIIRKEVESLMIDYIDTLIEVEE